MTTELHEGPIGAPPVQQAPLKLSWREKRYRRRRRRVWFEEILGWILVPLILFGGYWLFNLLLNAIGMSPSTIMDGINAVLQHL